MPDWQELLRQRLTGLELDSAESAEVIVMTPPALVAETSLPSGSWVAGSSWTAALIAAATLAASVAASVSAAVAVYETGTELMVVTRVSPGATAPLTVAVCAAGTGGAAA